MSILLNTSPVALAIEGTLPDTLAEVDCSVGLIGDTVRDTSVVIRATLITLLPDTPVAEIDSYESDGNVEPPIGIGTGAATSALTFPDGSDSVHSDWYCTPAQPRPPQIPCSGLQSEEACAVLGGTYPRWNPYSPGTCILLAGPFAEGGDEVEEVDATVFDLPLVAVYLFSVPPAVV